jgi:hypothetical protein
MTGGLTAATVPAGGTTTIEAPGENEDLFIYVTDGKGQTAYDGADICLGQYDVILATADLNPTQIQAGPDAPLHFMSFYLPRFLN